MEEGWKGRLEGLKRDTREEHRRGIQSKKEDEVLSGKEKRGVKGTNKGKTPPSMKEEGIGLGIDQGSLGGPIASG